MKQLHAEWIPWMRAYRLYDPSCPQQTIAYEENKDVAEKRAIENGYSDLAICDSDSMHVEIVQLKYPETLRFPDEPEKGHDMKFKWKYNAVIYRKMDEELLFDEMCDSYEEAQAAIEQNMGRFADKNYPPTGHINKDYVQVD